jgi:cytochrome c553
MRRLLTCVFLLSSALPALAAAPDGKTIAEQGNSNGAMSCSSCHGQTFGGNPAINAPALAGLPAATIEAMLNQFASPTNNSPMMHQVAAALSPAERTAVAAYLASQPKA